MISKEEAEKKGLIKIDKITPKSVQGRKNKFSKCKGVREAYKAYKDELKSQGLKPTDYKTYAKLIKDCNKSIVKYILESGDDFKFPFGLGSLRIRKRVRTYNEKNRNKWPVDYKKTKELGFIVYFTTDFKYKWNWRKRGASFVNKAIYVFIPCRKAKRNISKSINKDKKDYYF